MVTTDVELELRLQLKEAGKLLSNPPVSIDDLLHILDQTEKLLSLVDQSPNNLMQEALSQPMKALVDKSLLEHSNMDTRVSVASCLCEITRITAPEAPYNDEEMKGIFQCIVSSFENLSDKSSRSYSKRVSILETVSKVRSCVIMLDLECDNLVVKMFEHFLNSVRDHHLDNVFSLMTNIMALVLEESEDVPLDMLKPLLASIKNNSEGVLPVTRKLGEEVIKRSADKLRPYLNKAVTTLGDSLVDYSQVLTSICEGTTDFVEHNDESVSVQPKADETMPAIVSSDDAVQVMSNGQTVTGNEVGLDDKESKKLDEAVDHPDSNLTSKLHMDDSVAEKSGNLESKPDTSTKSAERLDSENVQGENKAEKSPEITVSIHKPLEIEVANAPSQSGSQQEESQIKSQITKGIRSKKKISSQTDKPSTIVVLTKRPEVISDSEIRSPKRVRKKTPKAEDNKPSATSGSDVEPLEKSTKKSDTVDLTLKKNSSGQDDESLIDVLIKSPEGISESEMRSPKRVRKKTPKAEDNKPGSDLEPLKKSKKQVGKVLSGSKPVKKLGKKVGVADSVEDRDKPSAASGSDVEPLKKSKPVKRGGKKVVGGGSVTKKAKLSGKKDSESKSKKSKQDDKKVDAWDSEVKPAKRSLKKDSETDSDAKPLKQFGKKVEKSKVITKPSEDIADKDEEETDSDRTPLKLSEKKDEETDSDNKPLNLSANKDDEETDSDNIPLKLSARKGNKSSSSIVKSSSKKKDGKKQVRGKKVEEKGQAKSLLEEKDQAKSSSEDDGMDVSLNSALKKATKVESNLDEALSTASKRKRSVTKNKVTETVKYDDSLVGQKVKVWWPIDKMYYEGLVASFDSAKKMHKVSYVDGDEETLNLKKEKWEILKEFSARSEEVSVEVQNTEVVPETAGGAAVSAGSCKDESEVETKLKEDDKKQETEKIVYSRGRKGNKSKTKIPKSSDDNVKESEAGDDVGEDPESEKEKSTETPKIGSKRGKKRKKLT